MIRGVIFDLGSTLIRFDGEWADTLKRMRSDLLAFLQSHGYAPEGQAFLDTYAARLDEFYSQRQNDWIEYTAALALRLSLAEHGAEAVPDWLIERALEVSFAHSESRWAPMPGAHALLEWLQAEQFHIGLISNASDEANVQRLIDNAGLRPWLDPIIVSAAVGIRKPNPRIFEMVLAQWGLPPAEAVMVGDTLGADVLGAQLAGMHSVWATMQADNAANRAHRDTILPEATIGDLGELPAVLAALDGARP